MTEQQENKVVSNVKTGFLSSIISVLLVVKVKMFLEIVKRISPKINSKFIQKNQHYSNHTIS